jgi:hypothetical protein
MERGEEEALGREDAPLADAYDRLVKPGDHPVEALIVAFRAVYSAAPAATPVDLVEGGEQYRLPCVPPPLPPAPPGTGPMPTAQIDLFGG